jgi:pilus assembly protein CpaB
MRTGVLIGLAVILAGVTFFLAKMWLDSTRQGLRSQSAVTTNQRQVQTAEILVAKANLPAGTRLKREHLEWRVWPKKGVVKTQIVKGDKKMEDVLGQIVRQGVLAGEPLVTGRIVKQGDRGYMAALLDPGMQAVSIRISKTTGVAGFIKPGDRVDVLLTITFKSKAKFKPKVTETILTDVLIIATDQVTNDQNTKPSKAKLITIQVTPKEAHIFTMGSSVGKISLVLRSLAREQYTAVSSTEKSGKSGAKDGKGARSGKDANAGNAASRTKMANSGSPASDKDDYTLNPLDSVTPLQTWHSELSDTIAQIGGKNNFDDFEVVRGNRSQRIIRIQEATKKKKSDGLYDDEDEEDTKKSRKSRSRKKKEEEEDAGLPPAITAASKP